MNRLKKTTIIYQDVPWIPVKERIATVNSKIFANVKNVLMKIVIAPVMIRVKIVVVTVTI
jgi:hypothetical protein